MKDAIIEAFHLIVSGGNPELRNIIGKTLIMCLFSSIISLILGLIIGLLISFFDFKGKKVLIVINRTLTGVPPVVCGLFCYILFSGTGPLGFLGLLFTVPGMIVAQVLLITPIVAASIEMHVNAIAPKIKETCIGLGLSKGKTLLLTANESRYQIISTYMLGFSRSIAEVGAVSMVGGAIAWSTNVMTTAIMQYTNMGNVTYAFALGLILLLMALIFNILVFIFQNKVTKNGNK